ncbi:hypothetical protein [Bauldia litoralis]|uniref:Uncharacterized protein n=1 Tax=Bauldia litoralis TaxID=665467 RepID=A0A1G6BWZ4_9HYPH|nr:hypothetical protein [Bauldia litoralis]SDB25125.1 hypothetical protein SAMN02982931_01950 [Bauldia litoralis]
MNRIVTHRHYFLIRLALVSAGLAVAVQASIVSATAGGREPLVGPHPWDFSERRPEVALAYQRAEDRGTGGELIGAAGVAAANGVPLIINSNSMAVGNWQQIEMTLGKGAEGLIMTENHQDNSGDQKSTSDVVLESIRLVNKQKKNNKAKNDDD